jgi:hypothetical protein
MIKNETAWNQFIEEVAQNGYFWTVEKQGVYATHKNRYGRRCFPWWSTREKAIKQIEIVGTYSGYKQVGFDYKTFVDEWIPELRKDKCMLGINYRSKNNIGFDIEIDEVIMALEIRLTNR